MKQIVFTVKNYITAFFRWLILGMLTGAVGGALGSAFALAVHGVTDVRESCTWLIYLLPIGGLATVFIYRILGVEKAGTNQVLESVRGKSGVSPRLIPAVFVSSAITHLLGGSAGKEGAALQIGGGISEVLGKILRLDPKSRRVLTVCGMGALFSAVFGTPVGACVFALEVASVGIVMSSAVFPCLVSSLTAFRISLLFGVHPTRFDIAHLPEASVKNILIAFIVAVGGAVLSVIFCKLLHFFENGAKKLFKNSLVRAAAGGAVIVIMTLAVGNSDYNGSGIDVIGRVFSGENANGLSFILKMLFTAVTVAAGFKGGEIVPSLFIGAAFGSAFAPLIGADGSFGAAVGMTAMFCGVTNCPFASVLISLELFGAEGLIFFAAAAFCSFMLSGNDGLYSSQEHMFSKLNDED